MPSSHADASRSGKQRTLALPVACAIAAVVALVIGLLVGHFVLGGTPSAQFSGVTTVAEGDLDRAMASYTYDGKTETVTVREAIESQTSLDKVKTDSGYTLPSADDALAVARNKILAKIAEDKGITVSDDELGTYAEQMTGSSDISSIASQYGMSEDQAKQIISDSAVMYKLKDQVVSTDAGSAPSAPETPADGTEDQASATYGAYIVALLGDEWNSETNSWAREDGPYYSALKDESFSADGATYAQAQKAYYVAYQQYSTKASTASSEWTNYVNSILSGATIELYTLGA